MLTLEQIEAIRILGSAINHLLSKVKIESIDGESLIPERERDTIYRLGMAVERVIRD